MTHWPNWLQLIVLTRAGGRRALGGLAIISSRDPVVVTACQIRDVGQTPRLEKAGGYRRSTTALAVQHDSRGIIELRDPIGKLRQRYVNRAGQMATAPFLRAADVHHLRVPMLDERLQFRRVELR